MSQVFTYQGRGQSRTDWLQSHHTFSFADFYDPDRMGFRRLRVLNEDHVRAGGGFAPHAHRNMEIITYVISGALKHEDSLGNGSIIRSGEIQRMSAGTGIQHSEMNASHHEDVHFLQIWIEPNARGHAPSYEQVQLLDDAGRNGFSSIVTPEGGAGAIRVHQDVIVSVAKPHSGERINVTMGTDRYGFIHVVRGQIDMNGHTYTVGDGLGFDAVTRPMTITAEQDSEVLLFDMA